MRPPFLRLLPFWLVFASAQAQLAPPELSVTLGETNQESGLSVPNAADGANLPVLIAGEGARRVSGGRALYLYVAIKHPAYASGPRDLYVTVEAADDVFARVTINYDQAAAQPDLRTKYTPAEAVFYLTGQGGWRKTTFRLPAARLGHGENFGADFRLLAPGVAFRRVTVSPTPPPGFTGQAVDAGSLQALAVRRPPGMELTLGNDATPADAAVYRALSVTSVESYVTWASVEPRENQWDWSKWDRQMATLQAAHLKWAPFLIAGPAYATPLWFHDSPHSHYFRCLEDGGESKVQSIFNPDLPKYVERFLQAFAERYRASGVLESVLLGVSGIYGESIYPAGEEGGGWTAQLTGKYHNRKGWWAGDTYAQAAFRTAMRKKYGEIAALNQAWGAQYAKFAELATFAPEPEPNDRKRSDFVEWYQQAMTDWALLWVTAARRALPQTEIYLCTGGDGTPQLGADFTAQAKAIVAAGAGMRITNEGSDYARNFTLTREVATATRLYGTFCGFEPASQVNEAGIVARIYNVTASGARQLHDYAPNTMTNAAGLRNFRAAASWLTLRQPQAPVALYVPHESWALEPGRGGALYDQARSLRDLVDHDFVTRRSIVDGGLRGHRALVLTEAPVLDPAAAAAIGKWVEEGGILFGATRTGEEIGSRLEGGSARALFAPGSETGVPLVHTLEGAAPPHWVLNIGGKGDEEWLWGQWFTPERGAEWRTVPGAQKRWTGARAGLYLPVAPGADYQLRLSSYVPSYALAKGSVEIRLQGQTIGKIEAPGLQETVLTLPAARVGQSTLAELELTTASWKPSDHGSGDRRELGVAIRQVELWRAGSETAAPVRATLRLSLDAARLAPLLRQMGQGWTVHLRGAADSPALLANVLAPLLAETGRYFPGQAPLAPGDGRVDGRYATQVDGKLLWLDPKQGTIISTEILPRRE